MPLSDLLDLSATRYHPQNKQGSYNYTDPEDYVPKDQRAGTTGLYRKDDRYGLLRLLNVRSGGYNNARVQGHRVGARLHRKRSTKR